MQNYNNSIMKGIGENKFAPDEDLTRAMFVTILYRMEKEPKAEKAKFSDVREGQWYTNAVAWANEQGIVSGVSDTKFEPDTGITREQMATILYRYMNKKGLDAGVSGETDILSYTDGKSVSDYAKDAIVWAIDAEIIKGETATMLSPQNTANRAQVATILMRFIEGISK